MIIRSIFTRYPAVQRLASEMHLFFNFSRKTTRINTARATPISGTIQETEMEMCNRSYRFFKTGTPAFLS